MQVSCEGLSKAFGAILAVNNLTFEVGEGEVLALLGPNGAGKTTTLRMLAAVLRPSHGRAWVAGYDTVAQEQDVRRSIGLLTEHHGLYTRMRALDYLLFFAQAYGMPEEVRVARASELLTRFDLAADAQRRIGEFSKGMRQKLALARALIHNPEVLLLDEPTSAMDPASARLVRQAIASLRGSRRAIVLSTHNLAEAEQLADRIAIIHQGRLMALGSPSSLKRDVLGMPVMELRFAGQPDGYAAALPPSVEVLAVGDRTIHYETDDAEQVNPLVLQAMAGAGAQVVSLAERPRSLEEVYMKVMGADTAIDMEP